MFGQLKGIWRTHEIESGRAWGKAVSELAKSNPGAVAKHIHAMKPEEYVEIEME